jgi:hypothetical protein
MTTRIYSPTEFCEAVTDEQGRLDMDKWNALFDKYGDDLSVNGTPGIADQIHEAFANGFRYAGQTIVPGTQSGTIKFVR